MLKPRRTCMALFFCAVWSTCALAAEPAWRSVAVNANFSVWRESEHPGWSQVGDAKLREGEPSRLEGHPGEGVLLSRGESDLYTREEFQDLEVKLEFLVAARSNSGVKLNGHYEIQIRDSHGKKELTADDCGGVYPRAEMQPTYRFLDEGSPPSENAARPAGEWQTLEIAFIAPRFDAAGKKTANARFAEVKLNGKLIQKDVELEYPTGHAWDEVEEVARGPLMLQGDHGPVAFRNIQVRALP